ncbi:hypothetical protein [Erwinia aphidicola]|uniref:Uncharacterized protein n=1 Tax=Erwinia aphidicola TaxID=68334 RepID=A0ABU8DL68_ERWAP
MINKLIEQIGGRERLEAIVYAMGAEPCDADPILDSVTHGDIGKMARALLSVLNAKPIAYIHPQMLSDLNDGARVCGRVWSNDIDELSHEKRLPLYTDTPAASAPDGLAAAVNRLLDSDGSRGRFSAIRCDDALAEVERLLAAAPAPGGDGG